MTSKTRILRPLFTITIVVLGGYAGILAANWYFRMVQKILEGQSNVFLFFIQQNPTQLSPTDKMWVRIFACLVGALLGLLIERLVFDQANRARKRWEQMAAQDKIIFFVGIILGLVLTVLIRNILALPDLVTVALAVLLIYTCVLAMESLKEQVRFYFPGSYPVPHEMKPSGCRPKILDTNVIIDGRIADICRAGFIEGPIYVPKFILEELQQIADSSDSLKRARGRRGLEILNQMRKELDLTVTDSSEGAQEEVDSRLVLVAKQVGGAIITNDYNLNRVAELQGVDVLNVNELANALKPVVLPGEEMRVTIIKEGKEKEQGIAYLDDGTMVVVENAKRLIGETLQITVTSVLQTVQGKMIFGKIQDSTNSEPEANGSIEESIRSYTGGGQRRKIR